MSEVKSVLDQFFKSAVTLKDPRYYIFYPTISGYCKGIGSYKSYIYNGASISTFNEEENPVYHKVVYRDDNQGSIDCIRLILREKRKLGDIFHNLPYGVIKKNIPGIGATTLALQQQCNTIIVVPTRALAYAKYITGYNKDKTQNRYFYVGSDINECHRPTDEQICEYLTRKVEPPTYKKIIVVADSLKRVMQHLDSYSFVYRTQSGLDWERQVALKASWKIMVDEIDSYQTDGVFRPAMENVIDYYFTFPAETRCLVSATIRPFSNPRLQEEPVMELNYEVMDKRHIKLINTDNIHVEVSEAIKYLRETCPAEKIVVAYNSITSIRKIIALLHEKLQAECCIACSPDSKAKVGEFFTILHSSLNKPITFITCSYFVGVDIKDRFHLISVSDIRQIYTILSKDKLYQISGRCRHNEGLLSESIIYNCANKDVKVCGNLAQETLDLSRDICELSRAVNKLHKKHPELASEKLLQLKDDIVDRTKRSYYGSNPIEIVRVNKDREIVPAYFNIDAIAEYAFLRGALYSNPIELWRILELSCLIDFYDSRSREFTEHQKAIEKDIDDDIEADKAKSTSEVIEKLKELQQQGKLTDVSIAHLRRERHREDYEFIDRFSKLYKYVPFDILVAKLQEGNAKTYRGFMRSAKYLALPEEHLFKLAIKESFKLGGRYTADKITEKLNAIFVKLDIPTNESSKVAVREFNNFLNATRSNCADGNYYIVKDHRPKGLDFKPLSLISDNAIPNRKLFDY